jgi:hypothetical protein
VFHYYASIPAIAETQNEIYAIIRRLRHSAAFADTPLITSPSAAILVYQCWL